MKVLCDVHIAIKVSKYFESKGLESLHVNQILDKWFTKDSDICEYADLNGMTVFTKDSDFKSSHLIRQTPKKLIKVNLGNISNNELLEILDKSLSQIINEIDSNEKCFIELNRDTFIAFKG